MPFVTITDVEIAEGKYAVQQLWQKIKDNEDYLNAQIGLTGLPTNGSFEVDTDADGTPDAWTSALLTGGAMAYDTATPGHGDTSIKFTDPGGAGNGGGYLESDYLPVNDALKYFVSWLMKVDNADVGIDVDIRCFDEALADQSADVTVYTETSGHPTSWTRFVRGFTITDADTRFIKIRLTGGTTGHTAGAARIVTFDNVMFGEGFPGGRNAVVDAGSVCIMKAEGLQTGRTRTSNGYIHKFIVPVDGTIRARIHAHRANGGTNNIRIYKNGVLQYTSPNISISPNFGIYSTDIVCLAGDYIDFYAYFPLGAQTTTWKWAGLFIDTANGFGGGEDYTYGY